MKSIHLVLCAALLGPVATAAVSLTSYELSGGYGVVSMIPGTNVTHYVVFGDEQSNAASVPAYAYSSGSNPISLTVSADRDLIYSDYPSGSITYSDSAGFQGAGSSAGEVVKNVLPLSTGYGGVGAKNATVSLEAVASDFRFELMMHNYYAAADMEVRVGGELVGQFTGVMKSTGSRNYDYLYALSFSNLTVGQEIEVSFVNLQNLGSDWSNLGFFSASINLETPAQFEAGNIVSPPNAVVPEPSAAALLSLVGMTGFLRRRRA